jgi:hypothetical protein
MLLFLHANTSDQVEWNVWATQYFNEIKCLLVISCLDMFHNLFEYQELITFTNKPILIRE